MRVSNHPLGNIGGYQMPTVGAIGGAKGVGASSNRTVAAVGAKRPRDAAAPHADKTTGGKGSKEEKEALARREAARARVQQRTMQAFGLR